METIQWLMGFLFLLLGFICIVDVLGSPKPMGKKILWIVFILFMPVLGIAVYGLAGRQDILNPPGSARHC